MKKQLFYAVTLLSIITSACDDDDDKITSLYSGKDHSGNVSLTRDKNTKEATLTISDVSTAWNFYAGSSVEDINFNKPILSGNVSGEFKLSSTSTTTRNYFQFETNEGKAILSERHLPMAGGYNTRDMGGFKTADGRYVKWGKVFRSDDLSTLTDADLKYLESIPLTTIVDFRTVADIESKPDRVPTSVKKTHILSLSDGDLHRRPEIFAMSPAEIDAVVIKIYEDFIEPAESEEKYKAYFKLLQDPENTPLLFHCSAGKDRAGMGAYFFLSALGVSEDVILADYLSSDTYVKEKYADMIGLYPVLANLFTVKEIYIRAAINKIKEKQGSVENYLTNVLEVDLKKMKELYLY